MAQRSNGKALDQLQKDVGELKVFIVQEVGNIKTDVAKLNGALTGEEGFIAQTNKRLEGNAKDIKHLWRLLPGATVVGAVLARVASKIGI